MNIEIFESIQNLIEYVLDIRWYELVKNFLFLFVIGASAYIASMVVIGFPVSIIEAITKKKINEEATEKIIKVLTVCISIVILLVLFRE